MGPQILYEILDNGLRVIKLGFHVANFWTNMLKYIRVRDMVESLVEIQNQLDALVLKADVIIIGAHAGNIDQQLTAVYTWLRKRY